MRNEMTKEMLRDFADLYLDSNKSDSPNLANLATKSERFRFC